MRCLKQRFVFFVFVAWLVASVPMNASPIQWQLAGVTFSDGATASGAFTYDAALDLYAAWNITVTPGILSAYNYQLGVDGGFLGIHPAGQVDFVAFPPATSGRYIRLTFSSPLTDAGGTDLLRTDNSGFECDNCNISRYVTNGAVTSVPEPSNLMPVSAALVIAGLITRVGLRVKRARRDAHTTTIRLSSGLRPVRESWRRELVFLRRFATRSGAATRAWS